METLERINLRLENLKKEVVELGLITEDKISISDDEMNYIFWKNRTKRFTILFDEIDKLEKLKEEIKRFI